MKKLNWKILNAALWTEIVLSYVLPFKIIDDFQYKVGFPIAFISVYNTKIGVNPFTSLHLNPIGLLTNAIMIYFIILLTMKVFGKYTEKINHHGQK